MESMPKLPILILIAAMGNCHDIPRKFLRFLNGIPLITYSINLAKTVTEKENVVVLSDDDEICLIAERKSVKTILIRDESKFPKQFGDEITLNALFERESEKNIQFKFVVWLSPSSPLLDPMDIRDAIDSLKESSANAIFSVSSESQRGWLNEGRYKPCYTETLSSRNNTAMHKETGTFFIMKRGAINESGYTGKIARPFFINEKNAVEIYSFHDWWICEKLIKQKRILFVVTGHTLVGLGHVYRSLTLAHEITDHRIHFLCTKNSDLAVKRIAERDYLTVLQSGVLLEDVLKLGPDLVVNDILNTDYEYIIGLKERGIKVVNFEDSGSGAEAADLIINALYNQNDELSEKYLYGPEYFCLREEFIDIEKRQCHKTVRNLLITFGGTDPANLTFQTLCSVKDICKEKRIKIVIVTGPGYLHKAQLLTYLQDISYKNIVYIHKTGIMSAIMQQADIAISSAGRTVYELAHMRVPTIVMSQNAREHTHTFARPENGFEYIGIMDSFDSTKLNDSFIRLMDYNYRRSLYELMKRCHFEGNKKRVSHKIISLLEDE